MKERLLQIMNQEGMNNTKFAKAIGVQRSAISHYTSGNREPSRQTIDKILERFSYISPDWLLSGIGNMRRENYPSKFQSKQPDLFANAPHIPTDKKNIPEYRQENRDKKSVLPHKKTETENVITKETSTKKILKIMIFYSDNTYESFNPEK